MKIYGVSWRDVNSLIKNPVYDYKYHLAEIPSRIITCNFLDFGQNLIEDYCQYFSIKSNLGLPVSSLIFAYLGELPLSSSILAKILSRIITNICLYFGQNSIQDYYQYLLGFWPTSDLEILPITLDQINFRIITRIFSDFGQKPIEDYYQYLLVF